MTVGKQEKTLIQEDLMLPIYSTDMGAYQFDTFENPGGTPPYFLLFINVNSRKGYAFPMSEKNSNNVLSAMQKFISQATGEMKPTILTSDEDPAYTTQNVRDLLVSHNIEHMTTQKYNHNILGIINRFCRTIRTMLHMKLNLKEGEKTPPFTADTMRQIINDYNTEYHSSTQQKPDDFTEKDNEEYIKKQRLKEEYVRKNNLYNLRPGQKVQVIVEPRTWGKGNQQRRHLDPSYYTVDSVDTSAYLLRAKDGSVARYPRYQIWTKIEHGLKQGETLDQGRHGAVKSIDGHELVGNDVKYDVTFENENTGKVTGRGMREGNPNRLSQMEVQYWRKNINEGHVKDMPSFLEKYRGFRV